MCCGGAGRGRQDDEATGGTEVVTTSVLVRRGPGEGLGRRRGRRRGVERDGDTLVPAPEIWDGPSRPVPGEMWALT